MQQSLFFAAGDLAETARGVAEQFGLDLPHFIAQCISVLIVAGLLYKFAYKPVLGMLEERRQRIAESLANAEQIKKDLANAQTKVQEILNQAGAQATKMIVKPAPPPPKCRSRKPRKPSPPRKTSWTRRVRPAKRNMPGC